MAPATRRAAAEPESGAAFLSGPVLAILAQRHRQIASEGFSPSGDDTYVQGELARAAAAYAFCGSLPEAHRPLLRSWARWIVLGWLWPTSWPSAWFKPHSADRDLERAGALIIAELERRQRAREAGR